MGIIGIHVYALCMTTVPIYGSTTLLQTVALKIVSFIHVSFRTIYHIILVPACVKRPEFKK
jgi:hypothetical protein